MEYKGQAVCLSPPHPAVYSHLWGLAGNWVMEIIQNRTNFGWEWGRIWKNKRMVFLSTKSLPCTPQCRGHFAAWEWYPCQGDLWLLLEWKFPLLQTLLCWEWAQCPGSTHARAGALGLSLLKEILGAVRGLTGSAPCPRNHSSGKFMQPPSCLRQKRACTQHTNVTLHVSCNVLYQTPDSLWAFQICVSQHCSLRNRTKNAALLPCHPQLFLWPCSGTNIPWPCGEADWEADQAEN